MCPLWFVYFWQKCAFSANNLPLWPSYCLLSRFTTKMWTVETNQGQKERAKGKKELGIRWYNSFEY